MGPVSVETVRGEPITVYGRTLVPVARVTSAIGHRGRIGKVQIGGTGWGIVFVKPLEIIEQRGGEVRTYVIQDMTSMVIRQMAIVGMVVSMLSIVLIWVNRVVRNH
jgi:uncharacterized spore protein YtfJ